MHASGSIGALLRVDRPRNLGPCSPAVSFAILAVLTRESRGNAAAVARRNTVAGVVFWSHGTDCSAFRGDI
jgi:hypothetical protein